MSSLDVIGAIRGLGQWCTGGLECLEIRVDKKSGSGLPNKDGKRVPIILIIGASQYSAGIRSTANNSYIWICRDARDKNNVKVSLAKALKLGGFHKNEKIILRIDNGKIQVIHIP